MDNQKLGSGAKAKEKAGTTGVTGISSIRSPSKEKLMGQMTGGAVGGATAITGVVGGATGAVGGMFNSFRSGSKERLVGLAQQQAQLQSQSSASELEGGKRGDVTMGETTDG